MHCFTLLTMKPLKEISTIVLPSTTVVQSYALGDYPVCTDPHAQQHRHAGVFLASDTTWKKNRGHTPLAIALSRVNMACIRSLRSADGQSGKV